MLDIAAYAEGLGDDGQDGMATQLSDASIVYLSHNAPDRGFGRGPEALAVEVLRKRSHRRGASMLTTPKSRVPAAPLDVSDLDLGTLQDLDDCLEGADQFDAAPPEDYGDSSRHCLDSGLTSDKLMNSRREDTGHGDMPWATRSSRNSSVTLSVAEEATQAYTAEVCVQPRPTRTDLMLIDAVHLEGPTPRNEDSPLSRRRRAAC